MSENILFFSRSLVVYCVVLLKPFWVYFCVWCERVFQLNSLTCGCSGLQAPLFERLIFSLCSYFLSQRLITVGVWVYYWALWPVLGRLRAGVEGSDRRWDGWMASLTQWTWVWINSGEMVRDREAWHAAVHGVTESQTWHSTDQQQLTCAFDPYKCFVLVPWSFDYCSLVVLSEFWAAFFFLHRIALVILGLL